MKGTKLCIGCQHEPDPSEFPKLEPSIKRAHRIDKLNGERRSRHQSSKKHCA